jgi:hypothetical protein
MTAARVCRWIAIALAAIAIVDASVPFPRRERPPVRVVATADATAGQRLANRLRAEGFPIAADGESASIITPAVRMTQPLPSTPIYVLTDEAGEPDVSIVRASVSGLRVAEQAIAVSVTVRARGGRGATTSIHLVDGGLMVASAAHRWSAHEEAWQAAISYLPEGSGALRLRVRADALAGERRTGDNVADLLVPPMRGPARALVIESGVTWPAAFVRRALEAAPGFTVAAVQRTTETVATRAGSPPRGMTRSELAPYEAVVIGRPASLDAGERDALRWFVEERGGVAVFVPDRAPATKDGELYGAVPFETRTLDAPVALGGLVDGLMASELAIPRALPALAVPLASDPGGAPIVFAMRRGMGAVIVSGALDAWRYRDRNDGAFARFWSTAILQQAIGGPPAVEVTAVPSLARPGDTIRVTARLRGTELRVEGDRLVVPPITVRAVNPFARSETVVRVWPSAEPGVYEGEWRPAAAGDYAIDATVAAASGAAIVKVAPDAVTPVPDLEPLAIAARATGGAVVNGEPALAKALADRFPSSIVIRPLHFTRSTWYAGIFALLLSAEWALRRRRGLS